MYISVYNIVVYFSDRSSANNIFSLWKLSSQNILASMRLENEEIPLVKTIVHPNSDTVDRLDLLFYELTWIGKKVASNICTGAVVFLLRLLRYNSTKKLLKDY